MSSGRLVALEAQLTNLKSYFIVERADYSLYTSEDHAKAIAFRLLSSASIEDYVEQRCLDIAKASIQRVQRGQPSATGRALLVRYIVRGNRRAIPIHDQDALTNLDLANEALNAYSESVRTSHGIAGKDLQQLVFPLALRDSQLPPLLVAGLNDLSKVRDPASHVYVNRAKTMTEPIAEWKRIEQLLPYIRQLDADLAFVSENYPL